MNQDHASLPAFTWVLFPLLWVLITWVLGFSTGWFKLQARFPADDEAPLLRLRMQSGMMYWIRLNGILTLDACRSGLRVSLWKLFGPFQQPFQVPWDQIEVEPVSAIFLGPKVRLRFGKPEMGRLIIDLRTWERLKAASKGVSAPLSRATVKRIEQGLFIQWLTSTLVIGTIFSCILWSEGSFHDATPVALAFGFPAIIFGIGQWFRYFDQMR